MTNRELEYMWTFFDVGKHWLGRRITGEQVRAKTRDAALVKAEKLELDNQ